MGWEGSGTGLGRGGDGIVEPIRLSEQQLFLGLGKATEYDERATEATENRRAMAVELMAVEDGAARAAR